MDEPQPPRRTGGSGTAISVGLTVALLAVVIGMLSGPTPTALRGVLGFQEQPLGAPPHVERGVGHYAFVATQRGSGDPVSYNPCEKIRVHVNPDGARGDYEELVKTAMDHTSAATGFKFEYLGTTDRRDFDPLIFEGQTKFPPVLVAWSDAAEYEHLKGDVAGVGGSVPVKVRPALRQFATGRVVLNSESFARLHEEGQTELAQAIIDHEFGHLVGLDHVDDPRELMFSDNVGLTRYGPGDREGFALLGGVPCA